MSSRSRRKKGKPSAGKDLAAEEKKREDLRLRAAEEEAEKVRMEKERFEREREARAAAKKAAEEKAQADALLEELEEVNVIQKRLQDQYAQRVEVREKNRVAAAKRPSDAVLKKLDSNAKKNSAFVRKLKGNLFENQRQSLLNDVQKLNLTKYIAETVASLGAIAELNKADIATAVEVSTVLFQRYKGFAEPLREAIAQNLKACVESENKKGIRVYLRFFTELTVCGIFEDSEISLIGKTLKTLIEADLKDQQYLAVFVSFCKLCGTDVAGLVNRKERLLSQKHEIELTYPTVFEEIVKVSFRRIFTQYYNAVAAQLVKEHKAYFKMKRKNELIVTMKGDLHEDKQKEADAIQSAYEKILGSANTLSDLLDLDMPDLPEPEPDEVFSTVNIDVSNPFKDIEDSGGESVLWDDTEQKAFYENLTDLRAHVPEMLFRVKDESLLAATTQEDAGDVAEGDKVDEDADKGDDGDVEDGVDDITDADDDANDTGVDMEEESEDTMSALQGEERTWADGLAPTDPLSILIERLPTCVNRKLIDEAAIEYCHINNKGNRKRLALALFKVRRNRSDLLPFYSRMVATLHPGMPDLAEDLGGHLQGEFRFFVRKQIQDNIESKIKNIKFIGELTKFKIIPPKFILNNLTILVRSFKFHDVDVVCGLLECCGRFLYRSSATHVRTKHLLGILKKKRLNIRLDERQMLQLDHAIISCDPPTRQAVQRKVRSPPYAYLYHLVYSELVNSNLEKIIKKIRRFQWDDPVFFQYIIKCFVRIWIVKYGSIRCFASLLAGLSLYHEDFAVMVVDATLEEVRIGMEMNIREHNQRRVSTARYLAEMYNFRQVESKVIFNTLFSLITYGQNTHLDTPTNYFRCKLVCTILDACGQLFSRGRGKGHLDKFFVYFQRYLYTKVQPLPIDTEIMVYDTMELLRPKQQLFESFEEAVEGVEKLEKEYIAKHPALAVGSQTRSDENTVAAEQMQNESSDSDESDQEANDDDGDGADVDADVDADADVEGQDETVAPEVHDNDDGQVVFLGDDEMIDDEDPDDDQFVNDYDKMLEEINQARRNESANASSIQKLDVAIPVHLKGSLPKRVEDDISNANSGNSRMVFTLLTRKGNKQTTQELVVPVESGLADRMLQIQEAEQHERDQNKRFVMSYEQRVMEQELAQQREIERQSRPRGRRLLFSTMRGGRGGGRGGSNGSGYNYNGNSNYNSSNNYNGNSNFNSGGGNFNNGNGGSNASSGFNSGSTGGVNSGGGGGGGVANNFGNTGNGVTNGSGYSGNNNNNNNNTGAIRPPGMGAPPSAPRQDRNFESELMRDMGYSTRKQAQNYTGGEPVFPGGD